MGNFTSKLWMEFSQERRWTLRLLKGLPKSHSLHNPLEEILAGRIPEGIEFDTLLEMCKNGSSVITNESKASIYILGHIELSPSQRDICVPVLEGIVERKQQKHKKVVFELAFYLTLISLILYQASSYQGDILTLMGWLALDGTLFLAAQLLNVFTESRRLSGSWAALNTLSRMHSPQAAGILAKECLSEWRLMRTTALSGLPMALDAVREEDFGRMGAEAVSRLCSLIVTLHKTKPAGWDENIERALIALERAGDSGAIPTVQRLVNFTNSSRVKQAAEKALTALQYRSNRMENMKNLLRSSSSLSSPESLLRASMNSERSNGEQLLRAGSDSSDRKE